MPSHLLVHIASHIRDLGKGRAGVQPGGSNAVRLPARFKGIAMPARNNASLSDFRRSRIYAEGWNAARASSLKTDAGMTAPNPYANEPERSRWNEGFSQGLGKN